MGHLCAWQMERATWSLLNTQPPRKWSQKTPENMAQCQTTNTCARMGQEKVDNFFFFYETTNMRSKETWNMVTESYYKGLGLTVSSPV